MNTATLFHISNGSGLPCAAKEDRMGICNYSAATIRINTELAKKLTECREYIVLHELAHLNGPTHSA
jgi:predicted metal-dependent hydrolase